MTPDLIQTLDVLDDEQLEYVLKELDRRTFEPATIFNGEGRTTVDERVRSNSRCSLPEESEAALIMHDAVNAALLDYKDKLVEIHKNFNGFPVPGGWHTTCWREAFQVLKYEHQQKYEWHCDTSAYPSDAAYHRTISVVLYLKNATKGGRTMFPHKAYKPKPGQALMFPSNWCFPHSAEPIEEGTKMVAVTWYHSECHA